MSQNYFNSKTSDIRQLLTLLNLIEPHNVKIVEIAKQVIGFDTIQKEVDSILKDYIFISNDAKHLEIRFSKLSKACPSKLNGIYFYQSEFEEIKNFFARLLEESRKRLANIQKAKITKSEIKKVSIISKKEFEELYRDFSSSLQSLRIKMIEKLIQFKRNCYE